MWSGELVMRRADSVDVAQETLPLHPVHSGESFGTE